MAFDASAVRCMRSSVNSPDFDFSDPFTILDDLKSPSSAPMLGTKAIRDYLASAPLESSLKLDSGGKLYFHWANWAHTCQLQREIHAGNPARLDALEMALSSLKRIETFLKSPKGTIVTSLYELYASYLDPRLRVSLFGINGQHTNEREILFSDVGEAGPFSRLAAMRWFDKNIYALFVFRKLLLGFVPQRQFRLGTSVPATWWLKGSPLECIETVVHQISRNGVLFKIENRNDFIRLVHGAEDNVLIHFPAAFLRESKTPGHTIKLIDSGETIPLHIEGEQLIHDGVWHGNSSGEQSFFFIKSETLFKGQAQDFEKAALSYEQWFSKELK